MSLLSSQAITLPQTPIYPNYDPITSQRSYWERRFTQLSNLKLVRWLEQLYGNNVGLFLIAASQLFITLMNIMVKFLNQIDDPVPTLELILVRMVITYGCSITYMLIKNVPHPIFGPPEVRYLLIIRGVCGFFGLFGLYYPLIYLSLSDTVILSFLAPTTTSIAGFLLLHETISRREVFAGLLSLFGVVLVARPQSLFGTHSEDMPLPVEDSPDVSATIAIASTQRLIAVGVAMIGVIGSTGAYVTLRAVGKRAHTLHSLTFFSSYCVIVSIIGMVLYNVKPVIPTRWSWCALLLLIGIFGFIAQVLLTMGLQRETASRGTLALYTQIVFATALERFIFNVTPSYLSIFGAFIIMGSAVYIAVCLSSRCHYPAERLTTFTPPARIQVTKDNEDIEPAYKLIPQNTDDLELNHPTDNPAGPSSLGQESSDIVNREREVDKGED
ncbi:hypothetical protein BU17DRAFT_55662 [Hysterangium stoloniferum]|nr:hypothetical protein BU17DRAFT_55662 [Hysterangium stoloniferum]